MKRILGFKKLKNGWSYECDIVRKIVGKPAYNPLNIRYFEDEKTLRISTPKCKSYCFSL